ncbi:hypothetical protein A3Q56_03070 [Intoshia linei]|uniref:Tubulin binding cofactor C-like domain-containing protein n=1 Tax=Intoshia linei TaxID=1819745 RepID=A0A177B6X2_9BILA|nr:hypothetical protein A3Q56_03070 [Intoshia linei]
MMTSCLDGCVDYTLIIENKVNEDISRYNLPGSSHSVLLQNIANSCVVLKGNASTIRLVNIYNSHIDIGGIKYNVTIDNAMNSNINVACQHIRLKNGIGTTMTLHITGSCELETCRDVKIGKYSHFYSNVKYDLYMIGMNPDDNYINRITDFNWARSDIPSPNWSYINLPR